MLAELISKEVLREPLILAFSNINTTEQLGLEKVISLNIDLSLMWRLVGLMSIGAILFIKNLINFVGWRTRS